MNLRPTEIRLLMRTKLLQLVLAAVMCCGIAAARAQTPAVGGPPGMPVIPPNPLGVSTNVEELLLFDSELPFNTVIQSLAERAGLKFRYAEELTPGGQPGPILTGPVGNGRFENMTAFEALVRLLRKNSLVLGRYANSPDVIIGTKDSKLTPVLPEPGDLDAGPGESELEVFADTTSEIPVQTAIVMLSKFAKISVVLDPKLKTGDQKCIGTNNCITFPAITNATVNLGALMGTPRQRLDAILNANGLVMTLEPSSQSYLVTYKDPTAREPLLPYVIPLRYSNTTNILTLIREVFPPPGTRINADIRTASLLVMATAKDYDSISNLVSQLDTPTKQVLIEARFLETSQNPKSIKGVDWTDTLQGNRVKFANGQLSGDASAPMPYTLRTDTTTSQPTITPNGRPGPNVTTTSSGQNTINTFDPASPTLSAGALSGFNPATAFLNAQGVNVVLSLLNSDADTRTLATPRVVTLDNMETKLEVTRAIPIFDASETVGTGGNLTTASKPTYTNIGTILIVTPRISGTNVAMRVKPEISRVEPTAARKVVAGRVNEADIFATSKIETSVIVPSGNTLVMGGLVSDSTAKSYTKVPILGDIPLLGWAFRKESNDRSKANLIIFLTPTIVYDEDFQPYRTEFLNTKMPEHPKVEEGPMTSGKPAAFTKKAKAKQQAEGVGSDEP
jgi:type II secretory pathway component GspD/PulD (secretin)